MSAGGVNRDFWKGRRVFLTGHTGFMGGWLAAWLARLGARVTGYALKPPTDPSFFEAFGVAKLVDSKIADVRDLPALAAALRAAKAEIVMHLAAQPLVRQGYAEPVETFSTNVMGTVHLLEAMRACPSVAAAVIVTSDKVYDNREQPRGYREHDVLGGREPYGASKACTEIVVRAYRDSFFDGGTGRIGIATARAGNVIGGGDWAKDRIVPDAVRAFSEHRPLLIRNPHATRPWQHVLEPLRGYLMLAERLMAEPARWSGGWNFGPAPSDARPVSWIADEIAAIWGEGACWHPVNGTSVYEAKLLSIDIAKAESELGWHPAWPVERAAAATVDWYKGHLRRGDAGRLTHSQIEAYEHDC
ncbi:MAG: CDP-glucose 4,6-dehydratase [Alphaproteobacteria bacterium]